MGQDDGKLDQTCGVHGGAGGRVGDGGWEAPMGVL